jgi:ureidoacrylate peracid hydrolase
MTAQPAARHGLVVVDMQNAFCQPGGAIYVPEASAQLALTAAAIQIARAAALPVIYTAVVWEDPADIPAGLRRNNPDLLDEWNAPGSLGAGCWGAGIAEPLAPRHSDPVLRKKGFHCPGLAELTVALGLSSVFLTGTTANNCVYAAALALFEADLEVLAIQDCISSFSNEMKEPWLHNIARFLGAVISFDDYSKAAQTDGAGNEAS